MKLVAKCLIKELPYACARCKVNDELKKDFEKHLLLPVCLKEYSFDSEEMFLLKAEILGNSSLSFLKKKGKIVMETGYDIGDLILKGFSKIKELMDSMEIYDIILPTYGVFCGTKYMEDGTFSGGLLKKEGILPAYLKSIKEYV